MNNETFLKLIADIHGIGVLQISERNLSIIERDILLSKIRNLYEQVSAIFRGNSNAIFFK